MLITVYCVRNDLSEVTFSLEVDDDFELENFRALCELESGIPASETLIVYAERPLTDNHRSLASYGLKDGDVVVLRQKEPSEPRPAAPFPGLPRIDFSSIAVPGTSQQPAPPQPVAAPPDSTSFPQGLDNPVLLREMLLANPHELSLLKERNPPLAEALLSGDIEKFTKVLLEQQQERARREQERIRLFSADPFDLDAQAKIEEDIRQQNIEENMTIAMEEAPESFGQVVMLYINCKVNGYPVKAFVDSGAQMTIMSQACAERCHIMRLVDRRWAGIAKGVGTQKIIGRVHLAQVQIEGDFLPCSFSILEEQPMDMLLGLDMLKRHQCSIDLEKNVLVIGTTGTRTSFLPEGELPECARLAYGPGRDDMRPEEIADRELAEVLQKSADEADKETTSLKDPLLVAPTDGHLLPAHPSDTEAPAVCSHPSAVTQSTEPLEELSVESSAEDGLDLHIKGGLPTGPPSAVISGKGFSLCKNVADSGVSDILGADRGAGSLQIDQAVTDIEGGADSSMLDPCDIPRPVEPIHSSVLQSNSQTQDDFDPKDSVSDSLPDSSADIMDGQGGGALSVCAEAPMDVDVSAVCHNDQNIPGAACESPGFPEHQRDDSVTQQTPRDSTMQLLDDKGSENPNPLSEVVGSVSSNMSAQHVEDHCFSLATALKELHKLLVLSGQGPCRTAQDDAVSDRCETSCVNGLSDDRLKQKEDASAENIVSDGFQFTKSEDGDGTPNQDLSSSVDADERITSASGLDFTDSTDLHRTSAESSTSCSATVDASNTRKCLTSNQTDCPTSNQTDCPSENQEPLSGSQTEKDLACDAPKITSETSTEGPSPSQLPPSFPTSAVEQIVSAGFSVEDAVLALENADGNAELALLALLVKNIVVPT